MIPPKKSKRYEYNKRWRETHRGNMIKSLEKRRNKIKLRARKYRLLHPEYLRRNKEWRTAHKEMCNAYNVVKNSKRYHGLVSYPCAVCGKKKVQAHHPDYKKPSEVVWLCVKHHQQLHSLLNVCKYWYDFPVHDTMPWFAGVNRRLTSNSHRLRAGKNVIK